MVMKRKILEKGEGTLNKEKFGQLDSNLNQTITKTKKKNKNKTSVTHEARD